MEKVLKGGAYHLKDVDGESHIRSINGQFLKQYHPTLWEIEHIAMSEGYLASKSVQSTMGKG